MKKRLLIILAALALVISTQAPAFAEASFGFRMDGGMGHLEYEDGGETAGYSFKAIGGSITGSSVEHTLLGDVGIAGSLGVSVAGRRTLNGQPFVSSGWLNRSNCYDYSASLGLRYGFTVRDFSLYAEAHVCWDSVVFQQGYTQTWERLSFHTLGCGAGMGITRTFHRDMRMTLSVSYDIGIKTFTAYRTRANWDTSPAEVNAIEARSGMLKAALGFTVDV